MVVVSGIVAKRQRDITFLRVAMGRWSRQRAAGRRMLVLKLKTIDTETLHFFVERCAVDAQRLGRRIAIPV